MNGPRSHCNLTHTPADVPTGPAACESGGATCPVLSLRPHCSVGDEIALITAMCTTSTPYPTPHALRREGPARVLLHPAIPKLTHPSHSHDQGHIHEWLARACKQNGTGAVLQCALPKNVVHTCLAPNNALLLSPCVTSTLLALPQCAGRKRLEVCLLRLWLTEIDTAAAAPAGMATTSCSSHPCSEQGASAGSGVSCKDLHTHFTARPPVAGAPHMPCFRCSQHPWHPSCTARPC
jgi:hypothetical protein